jgi:hypothetical protein
MENRSSGRRGPAASRGGSGRSACESRAAAKRKATSAAASLPELKKRFVEVYAKNDLGNGHQVARMLYEHAAYVTRIVQAQPSHAKSSEKSPRDLAEEVEVRRGFSLELRRCAELCATSGARREEREHASGVLTSSIARRRPTNPNSTRFIVR